jgi:prepilin peptidase CpaA
MRFIIWWPMAVVLCVATFTDLRSRRIPNWLVLPFMASGIAVSSYAHGMRGLGNSLAGLGLGAVVYGILYCLGGMGMGDVKLCAAIGAWIGPGQLMISIVITALVGGVMAICWAAIGGFLGDLFRGS